MNIRSLHEILKEHSFFEDLPSGDIEFISSCGRNAVFKEGARIAREGDDADEFYVIRSGMVAIETHVPHRGSITLLTLKHGDIMGWSWLFPPYHWTFDARAIEQVQAIALNGKCLREKCEMDTAMGYRLMKKFAGIMTDRLRRTRLQVLDVYASPSGSTLKKGRVD